MHVGFHLRMNNFSEVYNNGLFYEVCIIWGVLVNLCPQIQLQIWRFLLHIGQFCQIIVKSCPLLKPNSAKLVGDKVAESMIILHMVQQVSSVYEKFPRDSISTPVGLNGTLVLLTRTTIRKKFYYTMWERNVFWHAPIKLGTLMHDKIY